MRSRKENTLKSVRLLLWGLCTTLALVALLPLPLWAQATLDNPQPGSFQSGIGVIYGWVCEATRIEIEFDHNAATRQQAAYGTSRGDTRGQCGDTDNGFGLSYNWNLLGDGVHTVRALADGVEFANVTVTVTTLGQERVQGVSRDISVSDFPSAGSDFVLRWQEAQQNFVITDGSPGRSGGTSGRPPRILDNPQPGSFQSGIGVIYGWVCEASRIEIEFDNDATTRQQAAYGTSRGDTRGQCGDADNGFGLSYNWNLLGDGIHTVRALADGVEFARVTVTVMTLGTEFFQGASREVHVSDFPEAGTDVVLRWQEAQQNFVITQVTGPDALVRQGVSMLAAGNLRDTHEHFRQALELDPNSPQANLYSAITRIAVPILVHPDLMSLASRSGVAVTGDSSDVCAMRVTLPEQVPPSAPRTGEIIESLREILLPEIVAAIESLNRIASTAEIRFDLMNLPDCLRSRAEDVGIEQAEVEIDRSDIQALTAALQLAQATFEIAAAFDLDADLQLVTTQTSRDILDAEPHLLNLRSSAPLTTARNLVEQALTNAGAAIESVLAETDDQSDDVIEVLPEDVSDARLVQDTLESVRQSLRRRVTLPTDLGFDDPERLDLSLLFSGRFRTLRSFIPVFDSGCRTISIPTTVRGSLTAADASSLFPGRAGLGGTFFPLGRFPDPTFGGTTPDLTQQDINNQLLKGELYYADCYTFAGAAGQLVSLRVQSPAFDTVLALIGPDGRIVDDNDDCFGDSPNSCLPYDTLEGGRLTLPDSGSYTVEVSSYFAEESGDYTLTIGR